MAGVAVRIDGTDMSIIGYKGYWNHTTQVNEEQRSEAQNSRFMNTLLRGRTAFRIHGGGVIAVSANERGVAESHALSFPLELDQRWFWLHANHGQRVLHLLNFGRQLLKRLVEGIHLLHQSAIGCHPHHAFRFLGCGLGCLEQQQ
jgi:hypothetical protein